jgi:hypothetical protein
MLPGLRTQCSHGEENSISMTGKSHLDGKVITTPPAIFKRTVGYVMPIFAAATSQLRLLQHNIH